MLQEERHKRSIDIIHPEKLNFPIHILGAGGVGSWTALLLAKMGCQNISIYDFDRVEDHNVASQYFKESQLGHQKTKALAYNVLEQTGIKLFAFNAEFEQNIAPEKEELVIITVDSMKRRAELAEMFKNRNVYIIDSRMGGLQLEIYCNKAINYPKTIVDPELVDRERCTERAISFNCAVISGLIANYVRLYADNKIEEGSIIFGFNDILLLKQ